MDENVPSKILANGIQQYIKTAMHSSGKLAFLGNTGDDNEVWISFPENKKLIKCLKHQCKSPH